MATQITTAHWRDSSRRPRFFMIDAYATFPLLIFFLHIKLWTFTLCLIVTIFFFILERFGFTLPIFKRFIRSYLAGPIRYARPWWI